MSSPPDIDPYATLGVSKDATVTEIRAAHRKRVLKCHPDKIQVESQRNVAQDEFQRVQQAYELLSDETRRARYDQKAKLAELRREALERRRTDPAFTSSGNPREVRNGRIVEERVPAEVVLDEALRFAEDTRPMARKADDYGKRTRAKPAEEKKKSRTPMSSYHAAKEMRESVKATMADRAKQRDKDRRRQASAKYEEVYEPYTARVDSDDGASDSSDAHVYVRQRKPSSHRTRDSYTRSPNISRRRERVYDDEDDYSDRYSSKHDSWHTQAEEHIQRSKYDGPRASRSPPRARGYDSAEPEPSTSRRSGRSSRTTREDSYEHLESPRVYRDDFRPPRMPSSATSPGHKASIRPSLFSARTATATGFTRKRDGSSREVPTLEKMVREPISSRRGDSGYSSPSTPEMLPKGSSPKVTTRYKIDDPIIVEPSPKSKYRSPSPERSRGGPRRASTFNHVSEASPRIEVRTVRPSRPHGDVEWSPRFRGEDVKYTREIRPGDASMSPGRANYYSNRHPPPSRRQSTWA